MGQTEGYRDNTFETDIFIDPDWRSLAMSRMHRLELLQYYLFFSAVLIVMHAIAKYQSRDYKPDFKIRDRKVRLHFITFSYQLPRPNHRKIAKSQC